MSLTRALTAGLVAVAIVLGADACRRIVDLTPDSSAFGFDSPAEADSGSNVGSGSNMGSGSADFDAGIDDAGGVADAGVPPDA